MRRHRSLVDDVSELLELRVRSRDHVAAGVEEVAARGLPSKVAASISAPSAVGWIRSAWSHEGSLHPRAAIGIALSRDEMEVDRWTSCAFRMGMERCQSSSLDLVEARNSVR